MLNTTTSFIIRLSQFLDIDKLYPIFRLHSFGHLKSMMTQTLNTVSF